MLTSEREQLARRVFAAAHITGQFRLRSGGVSAEYFDKYLFESDPVLLREIAHAMRELLPKEGDTLAGLEMGGIPIATVLSQFTGLPTVFVRKTPKAYGTGKLAEGPEVAGRRLVLYRKGHLASLPTPKWPKPSFTRQSAKRPKRRWDQGTIWSSRTGRCLARAGAAVRKGGCAAMP